MNGQASFTLRGRNPDVLTCISNLSNDEVFTPPELANRMLDTVAEAWAASHNGANLWADKTIRFLDPCTKSGVFLREITSRLTKGLANEIPDLEKRVNHILTRQVFGIGITNLTSLLARRSVYCSKHANGSHSIAKGFDSEAGNIWFERTEHTWANGKCTFCGTSQAVLDRGETLETHAYAFIHTDNIKTRITELFGGNMQFDVIIGNPPYQLNDGGHGASAAPIYQLFVEQAKKLEPRYLSLVIPARWFSGGKGLDDFRKEMLNDSRIRKLVDYPDSTECFPGIDLSGGVCYFVWDRDNAGTCEITTYIEGQVSIVNRPLLEKGFDSFVRYNDAVSIVHKIRTKMERSFSEMVSARKPFGFSTDFSNFEQKEFPGSVRFIGYNKSGFVSRSQIQQNAAWVDKIKVYISMAYGERIASSYWVLGKPFLGERGTCCSETYLVIGPVSSKKEATNVMSYIRCRLFRFLVLLNKPTQHATSKVYALVPMQDFSEPWTDEKLRKKYNITDEEWAFIEKMIRPMEPNGEGE
ncbi:Eco57I restriction-modification methylase domain-containing protein [Nitrosomonas ureae]|uniref:site-specific DNA-methyltransferase (adenine-specific) n=1 Tax=Nitrosomonas ureae TaxID=44577 RepID=A0A1H9AY04_9PROT|nr:Eco57I restriction-modification methylase domain-containing protein [Nitrosomonas ureae]SEP80858.1 site-specific DNA-methyltransferase (adenine-specific) [Nitrosomonas ureae]